MTVPVAFFLNIFMKIVTGDKFFYIKFAIFFPGHVEGKTDFRCPEEFGYYAHPTDCSLYYGKLTD